MNVIDEKRHTYNGGDLGAVWTAEKTTFRVWAPTADSVKLRFYAGGDKAQSDMTETLDMVRVEKGTWFAGKIGDLDGVYYTYAVEMNGEIIETCDPYARAVGVNGDRAMVINLAATNPKGWERDKNPHAGKNITDAIIYELHVRDFSSDPGSGIAHTGKFLGIIEKGTKTPSGKSTGLDYLKELGITHLHLNPVNDFATVDEAKPDIPQYNWGYDPKNYNVPEGSYATDPYDGHVRVREFKEMVKTLHDNSIGVIIDVVYNHTYDTNFCFNRLVPEYFYRYNEDGSLSNGSGCGNDTASERAMVRKFIVDSVVYWAREYHVDGFRFDLMGLHDAETMNIIRAELDKIDPSVIVYGEGWDMPTALSKPLDMAIQANAEILPGIAMFNDGIRDAIKGSVFNAAEKGYVNGAFDAHKISRIKKGVLGLPEWARVPTSVITYAASHDNHTLWDTINISNGGDSLEDRVRQSMLAGAIIFTSQGTPFMLAGEEMLRSKVKADGTFDHNSYASPDSVNSIKWNAPDDPLVAKVLDYYRGLIKFRKAHAAFRMTQGTEENITFLKTPCEGVLLFSIQKVKGETSDGIFVVYNAARHDVRVDLPDGYRQIYIDGDRAGTSVLATASGSVNVQAISCMVLSN